tara:strand:- start:2185 stop:2331 length:147 start_codon:yes stop_codon:yes gene_type:complete
MIKEILYLLKQTNCQSDIVQLAKGKNKYPETFKELLNRTKQQRKWLRK